MKQTTRLVSKEEAAAIRARAVEHAKNATGTTVRIRGLGDVIAAATSAVGIKPCGGCKQRQEALNKLIPFGNANEEGKNDGTPSV
jgi:hypothetical protein